MHWTSFSWGALASLAIFLVVDSVHRCQECERRTQLGDGRVKRDDPFDWINASQFREMITAADVRYLTLSRRYSGLKTAVAKLLSAQREATQEPETIAAAAAEVDAALAEPEVPDDI